MLTVNTLRPSRIFMFLSNLQVHKTTSNPLIRRGVKSSTALEHRWEIWLILTVATDRTSRTTLVNSDTSLVSFICGTDGWREHGRGHFSVLHRHSHRVQGELLRLHTQAHIHTVLTVDTNKASAESCDQEQLRSLGIPRTDTQQVTKHGGCSSTGPGHGPSLWRQTGEAWCLV